jgi:hypothetical protein
MFGAGTCQELIPWIRPFPHIYAPETWLRFHSTSVKVSDTRLSQPIDDLFLTQFAPLKKMASFCNFTFLRKPASWPYLQSANPSALVSDATCPESFRGAPRVLHTVAALGACTERSRSDRRSSAPSLVVTMPAAFRPWRVERFTLSPNPFPLPNPYVKEPRHRRTISIHDNQSIPKQDNAQDRAHLDTVTVLWAVTLNKVKGLCRSRPGFTSLRLRFFASLRMTPT